MCLEVSSFPAKPPGEHMAVDVLTVSLSDLEQRTQLSLGQILTHVNCEIINMCCFQPSRYIIHPSYNLILRHLFKKAEMLKCKYMYVCIFGTPVPTVPLGIFNAPIILNLYSSPSLQSCFIPLLGCPLFPLSTYTTPTQLSILLQIPPSEIFSELPK